MVRNEAQAKLVEVLREKNRDSRELLFFLLLLFFKGSLCKEAGQKRKVFDITA